VVAVAAWAVPAAVSLCTPVSSAAAAVPGHCGACQSGGPIASLEARIASVGHSTLCEISDITPENQGGTSTIEIMSFSATDKCTAGSTAHQGVVYFVDCESPGAARYLLALASVTSSFVDGWQGGKVDVMLGRGTSVLHQLQVYRALERQARFAFGRHTGP
jgi:hypothetical protein